MNLIIIIGTFLIIYLFILIKYRKNKIINKVRKTSITEKLLYINAALYPFGFEYDEEQDIVISRKNAWQKEFGYHDIYDINAPLLNIVMDCEPILFNYNNKDYRIELWKGQYGIATGAEIGIYIKNKDDNFYRGANRDEELEISFFLNKNCLLLSRKEKSWWITGFEIGTYSKPKDLKMNIEIKFPNLEIQQSFIKGLNNIGYTNNKIINNGTYTYFEYCKPHNYQLNHNHIVIKLIAQLMNRFNCFIYRYTTRYFNNNIDRLTYLRYMLPNTYTKILNMSMSRINK